MTSSDDVLLSEIARGDRRAAAELMRRHLPKIVGLSQRTLGSRADAEEVSQEVFLRIWKQAPNWEAGRAKFSTWVHRVTLNLCYDRLRKRRETAMETPPEMIDESRQPGENLLARQRKNRVDGALSNLPERQKTALLLCHYQELGNIEAAEIMNISVEALESLLSRGRRGLRKALLDERDDLLGSMRTD